MVHEEAKLIIQMWYTNDISPFLSVHQESCLAFNKATTNLHTYFRPFQKGLTHPPSSKKRPNMPPPLRNPPLRRPPLHNPRQQTLPPRLPRFPHTDPPHRQRSMSRRLGLIIAHHPPRHNPFARAGTGAVIVLPRSCRVLAQYRLRGWESGWCVLSYGRFCRSEWCRWW